VIARMCVSDCVCTWDLRWGPRPGFGFLWLFLFGVCFIICDFLCFSLVRLDAKSASEFHAISRPFTLISRPFTRISRFHVLVRVLRFSVYF
jgi:hypothetical protein